MSYKEELFDLLTNFEISNKEKVDYLLMKDTSDQTNLGSDSTVDERERAKSNSVLLYKGIRLLDKETGKMLLTD
jgi:hypothetical protein